LRAMVGLVGVGCGQIFAQTADVKLTRLADRFVQQQLEYDPTIAYSTGIETKENGRLADRSPKAIAALNATERRDLSELQTIDVTTLTESMRGTYASLREQLEADVQVQVCRSELWNVNHFNGWQSELVDVAARQPVITEPDRAAAMRRWKSMPRYADVEVANLRIGLGQGYSAPRSVVERVVKQIDAMTAEAEKSPFDSPAERSHDATFAAAYRRLVADQINPALRRYRDFLQNEYLPKAREGVAISDLPHGAECYAALLRQNTTLKRSPQQVFELGQATVEANFAAVQALGEHAYGSRDVPTILAAIRSRPAEKFLSKEDLLSFSQAFLARAREATGSKLIAPMPKQDVSIRPLSALEEDAGVGSRFQQEPDAAKPSVYLIRLGDWRTETRAEAEIVTVHETIPGHALQKAVAGELPAQTQLAKLIDNSAYSEGWARYAEAMSEEAGIYDGFGGGGTDAEILRRLWPARGMVVDPGLHAMHWTREQAITYIMASGRFTREAANDYVDRIAVMPGQLTSYDSGGLEIRALRKEAEARLGRQFDLRQFNHTLLDEGVLPLEELRAHVERWIAAQQKLAAAEPQ
jgi:uncharacterized protein (DUF885 family)